MKAFIFLLSFFLAACSSSDNEIAFDPNDLSSIEESTPITYRISADPRIVAYCIASTAHYGSQYSELEEPMMIILSTIWMVVEARQDKFEFEMTQLLAKEYLRTMVGIGAMSVKSTMKRLGCSKMNEELVNFYKLNEHYQLK
jgi:hypothetical protein